MEPCEWHSLLSPVTSLPNVCVGIFQILQVTLQVDFLRSQGPENETTFIGHRGSTKRTGRQWNSNGIAVVCGSHFVELVLFQVQIQCLCANSLHLDQV